MFEDRQDAGRQLGRHLVDEATSPDGRPAVVVGLARGGIAVAAEVADLLGAPLDVMIVRKIGVPWHRELGVGAIAEGEFRVLNDSLIAEVGLREAAIDEVAVAEERELERRRARYRGDRPPVRVAGRTVIVVDDGLATGYTAWAAILAMRARGAARVVLGVPVAPPETVTALAAVADRVVAVRQPPSLMAIGEFYRDFSQASDADVIEILLAHRPPASA